jgi:hypothetical protein
MMLIKTADLTNAALDWAVGSIEKLPSDLLTWHDGSPVVQRSVLGHTDLLRCEFSTNWAQGGPIIEREWIEVVPWPNQSDENERWMATQYDLPTPVSIGGPTPLIAAMRCLVASKLGDTVEIPDGLI